MADTVTSYTLVTILTLTMITFNNNNNMEDSVTSCTLSPILTITMITFNNNNNMADMVTSCMEREALSAMETLGAIRPCLPASVSPTR